jgi:RNA polymerase sigma factor (sigma-70 family)
MTNEDTGSGAESGAFHTTRWTRVMKARGDSDEAKIALSELCEIYYAPVRAFVAHTAGAENADDKSQAFFARLLERAGLENVDPGRGRFRSYLLGAVKHFLRDEAVKLGAQKRGGGSERVPLDDEDAQLESAEEPPPDALFDREWAMALIARALDAVEQEQSSEKQFAVLKPWLSGGVDEFSQADAAAELGISEGAVKVAIHRLRKRFRQCVRDEIGQTVSGENEISAELNYLIEVLATPGN